MRFHGPSLCLREGCGKLEKVGDQAGKVRDDAPEARYAGTGNNGRQTDQRTATVGFRLRCACLHAPSFVVAFSVLTY
jgi:hypothetical protein